MSFGTRDVRFLESVAPCSFWRERGQNYRGIATGSNEHVGGRVQWLHTWHWQHWVAGHKNTEDVIQPRLREIDRFFFITRGQRLFTEVLAPDGIASGLAQVGLFMGDKNAPDEFGAVFRVRLTSGKHRSPKRMAAFIGAARMRTSRAPVGSHFSQTMFLERICWRRTQRTNANIRWLGEWAR